MPFERNLLQICHLIKSNKFEKIKWTINHLELYTHTFSESYSIYQAKLHENLDFSIVRTGVLTKAGDESVSFVSIPDKLDKNKGTCKFY